MTPTALRSHPGLQLWAGLECTLNRVGDARHDQLALTGHYARPDDLDRLAALGIRTIRFPVLWERIDAGIPDGRAWEWTDRQLARLRELGIEPIVGLLHHGSGPPDTSLLDPGFPERLARYARQVAERWPWVRRFTPINEPLTTARFSALYGAWYPHLRDDAAMVRAALTQLEATRLAMQAIRGVIPDAELVQTEDLGCTHSTQALRYQAEFENERRWLTFDALLGRFGRDHPLREYARWAGVSDDEIDRAIGDGCPPALIGINHYVTSERWLDDRLELYPQHTHGGNHRQRYADVEAVRAVASGVAGPRELLMEAWERYRIPIAVTECHIACTREQQLRWMREVWTAAEECRAAGADVRAVTAWAAFGARDWSSLVTTLRGDYEPGLFDVRAPAPRATALARMAAALATSGEYEHPALEGRGWWRCRERLHYGPESASDGDDVPPGRPLLVVGARGTLGRAFVAAGARRGLRCEGVSRAALDVADRARLDEVLERSGAWAIVNAAGYVRVDAAEDDEAACRHVNVAGTATLAAACAERDIPLLTFSSDLVFDGAKDTPYVESDLPRPLGVYGRSKADAESLALSVMPSALVVRTAAFFGPDDDWNFVTQTLRAIAAGRPIDAAEDLVVSPTYVPDLVDAALDLLIDGERGIWHLANAGAVSWAELARKAAAGAGLDGTLVRAAPASALGYRAPRPRRVALGSERAWTMPSLDDALARYLRSRAWQRRRTPDAALAIGD